METKVLVSVWVLPSERAVLDRVAARLRGNRSDAMRTLISGAAAALRPQPNTKPEVRDGQSE